MQPVNIDLKSDIVTEGDNLISSEPKFTHKNSLLFNGIASNMKKLTGNGMLSTTGKQIEISGNVVSFGDTVKRIDNSYTIEASKSLDKTEDEVIMKWDGEEIKVASVYIDNHASKVRVRSTSETYTLSIGVADVTWIAPVSNLNDQLLVMNKSGTYFYMYLIDNRTVSLLHTFNSLYNKDFALGNRVTGYYSPENDFYAMGFDDDDIRRRFTFISNAAGTVYTVARGMGLISPDGIVTGEPYLRHKNKAGSFWGTATSRDDDNLKGFVHFASAGNFSNIGANNWDEDAMFKILPNGVISAWTGPMNPDATYQGSSSKLIDVICDQNAKVNEDGSKGEDDWIWKLHTHANQVNPKRDDAWQVKDTKIATELNLEGSLSGNTAFVKSTMIANNQANSDGTPKSNTYFEAYYSDSNTHQGMWKNAKKITDTGFIDITGAEVITGSIDIYIYSYTESNVERYENCSSLVNEWDDKGKLVTCENMSSQISYTSNWEWIFAIDLNAKLSNKFGVPMNTPLLTYRDCPAGYANSALGLERITILGDYSYIFNSMKDSASTTDYDSIFPCLRMFFNNSNTRGKYYEYGLNFVKAYHSSLMVNSNKDHVFFWQEPTKLVTWSGKNWGAKQNTSSRTYDIWNNPSGTNLYRLPGSDYYTEYLNSVVNLGGANYDYLDGATNFYRLNCMYSDVKSRWSQYTPQTGVFQYLEEEDWNSSKKDIDYARWYCLNAGGNLKNRPTFVYAGRNYEILRRVKILGEGKGTEIPYNLIGGYGENAVVDIFNYSIPLIDAQTTYMLMSETGLRTAYDTTYENNDLLRLGVYQGIPTALTFKGTLLLNATDLDYKITWRKSNGDYFVSIYNGAKVQSIWIKQGGDIKIDKISDYLFRLNSLTDVNLIVESHEGLPSFQKAFSGYIGEEHCNAMLFDTLPSIDTSSENNQLFYAQGLNSDLLDDTIQPGFLFPAKTINGYIAVDKMEEFNKGWLQSRKNLIFNKLKACGNFTDKYDVYYASSSDSSDVVYRYSQELPNNNNKTIENEIGTQVYDTSKADTTWWIDADNVIYPIAISSNMSGVNYSYSTVDLPGNYASRIYSRNNKTWAVYNSVSQVYMGEYIFTLMGGNYYFDGQGVYYLGSENSSESNKYSDNSLVAYAVGMKFLCSSPSEAYFYSPFDKGIYIFTASNTLQKATPLSKFGEVLDACYCPVNQAIYLLFDGVLIVKGQEDMADFLVTGNRLYTTEKGVQVVSDSEYTLHNHTEGDLMPLNIETGWLGSADTLQKYSMVDVLFKGEGTVNVTGVMLTLTDTAEVKEELISVKINKWNNGFARWRLQPRDPIGNAFKLKLQSDDNVGVFSITCYTDTASSTNAAGYWN